MRNQEIRFDFLNNENSEGELPKIAIAMSLSEEESRVRKEEKELARILALSLEEK